MTDDEQALLNTILAHPEADLPRLVYADWLDDNAADRGCEACDATGEVDTGRGRVRKCPCCASGVVRDPRRERAEFIRLQCDLAENARVNRAGGVVAGDWDEAVARMRDLFFGHAKEWFALPGLDGPHFSADRVLQWHSDPAPVATLTGLTDRGFVGEVHAPLAWLRDSVCSWCEGDRVLFGDRCPSCSGKARIPGHLRDALRHQPIMRVVVTDRSPLTQSPGVRWTCHERTARQMVEAAQADLPIAVYDRLPTTWFDTEADARGALSDILLAEAREAPPG